MAERGPIDVAVVGSVNLDLSVSVPALPLPGETVLGGDTLRGGGGKGANQAVAAARLGARVAMIGRVGDDEAGLWLREGLERYGIDVRGLLTTPGVPSGMAFIAVDRVGENSIVVSPGANARVSMVDLDAVAQILSEASVVVAQYEIPLDVVAALPPRTTGRSILNPAPAPTSTPAPTPTHSTAQAPVADGFDILVPNRGELAVLAGAEATNDLSSVVDQARTLDAPVVIVTLGPQGAMVVFNEGAPGVGQPDVVTVPALPVNAVDTTAAGDSFCGALAVALVEGADVVAATGWAVRVAGETVTARGAQESLPIRDTVGDWRVPEGD